jgi:hypothetical protein
VQHLDPEKREEWDAMLAAPLPGQERRATPSTVEAEGEAFMALMVATGKGAG